MGISYEDYFHHRSKTGSWISGQTGRWREDWAWGSHWAGSPAEDNMKKAQAHVVWKDMHSSTVKMNINWEKLNNQKNKITGSLSEWVTCVANDEYGPRSAFPAGSKCSTKAGHDRENWPLMSTLNHNLAILCSPCGRLPSAVWDACMMMCGIYGCGRQKQQQIGPIINVAGRLYQASVLSLDS